MNLLYKYNNGNYTTQIFSDGTKIRETQDDEFRPEFSENIDIKITDFCLAGCAFCHEMSTGKGAHGWLDVPYLKTLHPGTEAAVGGGDPLDHPQLIPFLKELKNIGVISNITVNQFHFVQPNYRELLDYLVGDKLVYGVGISLLNPTDQFIEAVKQYNNLVIHTINGVTPISYYRKLSNQGLKILILGYKTYGRGIDFKDERVEVRKNELFAALPTLVPGFKTISFDNLGIEQLNPRRMMLQEQWDQFYMGDDGSFTFYIDMVQNKFAKNSTSYEKYDIEDGMSVKDMFNIIKEN
jgi:hypothetical protein